MSPLLITRSLAILTRSLFFVVLLLVSCNPDDDSCPSCPNEEGRTIEGPYDPQDYELDLPYWIASSMEIPEDNRLTVEGVALGRHLFYDPILSSDSTMSCASCHKQELAFTDGLAKSKGVLGMEGTRSSMSLANVGLYSNGLFWDGRVETLEEQALLPVEDHLELNTSWDLVENKLREHPEYPQMFRAAFGISNTKDINRDLAVKAISQFERTLISGLSRYDRVKWLNEDFFTDEERLGIYLFEVEPINEHPGCAHCHPIELFTDNDYKNNGLDFVDDLNDFEDLGRGPVTGNYYDNGKFRVPTLRNIALTAPYMHDGRFETLEEVLDHYETGGHGIENEDPNLLAFTLSEEEKTALLALLNALTDTTFINNPAFSDPFQ